MRISILLFVFVGLLAGTTSFGSILVVDNSPSAASNSFGTPQIAHDAAVNGDTIYVIGTSTHYGALTLSKSLKWFGPGYFLNQNPETQANTGVATIGATQFNSGSAGTSIAGLSFDYTLAFNAPNILFRRNYLVNSSVGSALINVNASNIVFEQCYVYGGYNSTASSTMTFTAAAHDIIVRNCIITSSVGDIIGNSGSGPVLFLNCDLYVGSDFNVQQATIRNTILRFGNYSVNNNFVSYSMSNSTQFGTSNNNLSSVNMNTVYSQNPADRWFQLSPTSPAIGTGENGVNMGCYGGSYPYVPSGIPNIPTITYMSAPSAGSTVNGLPVTFRARARN